jgi:hypothetical protein
MTRRRVIGVAERSAAKEGPSFALHRLSIAGSNFLFDRPELRKITHFAHQFLAIEMDQKLPLEFRLKTVRH